MYFEDEEDFEKFEEILTENNLDNDIKESYYDIKDNFINKRMLSMSIKIPIKKVIELGELYNSMHKFNI